MSNYAVTNPATGETVREYATISDEVLSGAMASVSATYKDWSRSTSRDGRADIVRRVAQLHRDRREALAQIIVREMGKPLEHARGEVDFAAEIYEYYAEFGPGFLADENIELHGGHGRAFIRRSSLGPLLGIMPWNFPYYQVARFAGPNLIIGNTVLLKHAPQCPESAAAIEQIFLDAGAPEGAYVNIYATNEQIAGVIADSRIQGVSLTGSELAGAAIAELAGKHLKKVVLELGGSDPFILLSTNDLDSAVEAAVNARLDNSGQACNAAKRFIVIDELYDAFAEKFVTAMGAVHPADPMAAGTKLGPLSSPAAAERLQEQLERAEGQGATVLLRGERDNCYFSPAVLANVTPHMDAYREEFFGPVGQLYRVANEDEAIAIANDTDFGLGSYLFTTDREQALRLADRIDAGMVWINMVLGDSVELPFGGIKRSGSGRELGRYGADEFVNKKLIRVGAGLV